MIDVLKKYNIIDTFPDDVKTSPEIRDIAQIIQNLRDEIISKGDVITDSLSIEDLDNIFKCERVPDKVIPYLNEFFLADIDRSDTDLIKRKKICRAVNWHRLHATVLIVRMRVEEVLGAMPIIHVSNDYSSGWDEENSIVPPSYQIDFQNGIYWDEDETWQATMLPEPFVWAIYPYGILVDILNDGAYTPEQLDKVYTIIADEKPADLAADVGYFDSVTGVQTILKRVYSTDLSQNSWNAIPDPGINN